MIRHCGGAANPVFGEEDTDRQKPQKSGSSTLPDYADRGSHAHVLLLRTASGGKLAVANVENPVPRRAVDFWLPSKTEASALRLIKSATMRQRPVVRPGSS